MDLNIGLIGIYYPPLDADAEVFARSVQSQLSRNLFDLGLKVRYFVTA